MRKICPAILTSTFIFPHTFFFSQLFYVYLQQINRQLQKSHPHKTNMLYPSISDYITSIRSAEDNFDKLSHLCPVLDGNDNPIMSSGNFAVVFKMTDGTKDYAVKCFMREQDGRNEAYRMIAEELEYVSSPYIAGIKYYEKELFVDSQATQETAFPVLLMDWVDGVPLDKYIAKNISDIYNLKMVAYQFAKLAGWLLTQPFAHGDLKPDNILVTSEGLPVLVDYDGMYVPAMKGQKARELGSPDYRHPQRTDDDFNEHIDDFALASIALSLKAISLDPSLLSRYGATERLLFSAQDYREIDKSEAIRSITSLFYDDELTRLYALFLVAHASKNLAHVSFRLFNMKKPEKDNSLSCTKKAADQGDAVAQNNLGENVEKIQGMALINLVDVPASLSEINDYNERLDIRLTFTYLQTINRDGTVLDLSGKAYTFTYILDATRVGFNAKKDKQEDVLKDVKSKLEGEKAVFTTYRVPIEVLLKGTKYERLTEDTITSAVHTDSRVYTSFNTSYLLVNDDEKAVLVFMQARLLKLLEDGKYEVGRNSYDTKIFNEYKKSQKKANKKTEDD